MPWVVSDICFLNKRDLTPTNHLQKLKRTARLRKQSY